MSEPLLNKRVLVTRPEEQAESLCQLISDAGGEAIRLPVITIRPVPDTELLQRRLALLTNHDIGIFVSQNAVRFTLQFLGKEAHALERLRILAIGKPTARALQHAGIKSVSLPGGKFSSETLLELPLLQAPAIKGKKVIIFRGIGGRERLAEQLLERGAAVEYLEVYQRLPAKYNSQELDNIWSGKRPDCVVVTSDEGLQNLFDMLSSKQQTLLLNTPLVVMSDRIAELAIKLGYRNMPVVAGETSDTGLIKAIITTAGA